MSRRIGGTLNADALATLTAAQRHRPSDRAALAAEAWRLITDDGLTVEDVSAALGLSSAAVRALLVTESVNQDDDP